MCSSFAIRVYDCGAVTIGYSCISFFCYGFGDRIISYRIPVEEMAFQCLACLLRRLSIKVLISMFVHFNDNLIEMRLQNFANKKRRQFSRYSCVTVWCIDPVCIYKFEQAMLIEL